MTRKSSKSIILDSNIRCSKVYPKEKSNKTINKLKTIGIKFSKDQAIQFARVLLAVTQEWDNIDITAYRMKKRKTDDTFPITITSNIQGTTDFPFS